MTYKVFGGTLILTQSINQDKDRDFTIREDQDSYLFLKESLSTSLSQDAKCTGFQSAVKMTTIGN